MNSYNEKIIRIIMMIIIPISIINYLNMKIVETYASQEISSIMKIVSIITVKDSSLWIIGIMMIIISNSNIRNIIEITTKNKIIIVIIAYIVITTKIGIINNNIIDMPSKVNKILVDINLVIHPILTYIGIIYIIKRMQIYEISYKNRIIIETKYLEKIYTIATIGLLLGCNWAYCELGWATYWFWDKIEIISLVVWLWYVITYHGKNTIVISGIITIVSIITVRIGILESIHKFSIDSNITYIIVILEMIPIMLIRITKKNIGLPIALIILLYISIYITIIPSIYSVIMIPIIIYSFIRKPVHKMYLVIYILLGINTLYSNTIMVEGIASKYESLIMVADKVGYINETMVKMYENRADIVTNIIKDLVIVKNGNGIQVTNNYNIKIVVIIMMMYVIKKIARIEVGWFEQPIIDTKNLGHNH